MNDLKTAYQLNETCLKKPEAYLFSIYFKEFNNTFGYSIITLTSQCAITIQTLYHLILQLSACWKLPENQCLQTACERFSCWTDSFSISSIYIFRDLLKGLK